MKLIEIIESKDSLKKLYETQGLPFRVALSLAKNINKVDEVLEVYEQKRRELVLKYAKKDENGNPIENNGNYKIDDIPSFNKAYSELVSEEAELDIVKIKAEDLESVSTLTPLDINRIMFLIDE